MAYSLKIEASFMEEEEEGDAQTLEDDGAPSIDFTAGNPRVEHINGVVHLYRLPKVSPPTFAQTLAGGAPSSNEGDEEASSTLGTMLCCLAIPADMSVSEFCSFCGAYLEHIREMRVLRREANKRVVCMVLVRFSGSAHAESFYTDLNNKPFCSLEPAILCRLVHVRNVEILSRPTNRNPVVDPIRAIEATSSGSSSSTTTNKQQHRHKPGHQNHKHRPPQTSGHQPNKETVPVTILSPPPGATELPSCPVCLERLDEHVSGVITTVCNHTFHSQCLSKWGDVSCPVCRYISQPGGTHASRCSVCSSCTDLWICLICGHVGCGRYKEGHAIDHWQSSSHCYALELETQRVWDYAGDNYVHRLIQSKTDGKLVEVPSPLPMSQSSQQHQGRCSLPSDTRSSTRGDPDQESFEDDSMKEAMIASKLDAISLEYNHLLASQLDSQRQYFEGLLNAASLNSEKLVAAAEAEAERSMQAAQESGKLAKEAERKRQAVEKKLVDACSSLKRLEEENEFLRSVNENLTSNQIVYQNKLQEVQADLHIKVETIQDLQEQVRDLMVFIEAQRVLQDSGEDLQTATVMPMPETHRRSGHNGKLPKGKQGGVR